MNAISTANDTDWRRSTCKNLRYLQSILNELLAEPLRRFLESHEASLTESFLREDVQWGLHGRD